VAGCGALGVMIGVGITTLLEAASMPGSMSSQLR
jgi:hypothetical protein